ncbi:MAG: hypothetical protein IPH56_03190 [Chitinophagaceae bacterium]|nr:hypothetical protein [Chitinophagaceae bacterium]
MKFTITLIAMVISYNCHAQNVGIGTTTPVEKLEVKKALRSTVKISSAAFIDTTELLFSNRNFSNSGTDFSIKNIREEGLYVSSLSDLSGNTSANSLVIRPNGQVGIGMVPTTRFQVNGASIFGGTVGINGATTIAGNATINGTSIMNGSAQLQGLNIFEFGAGVAGKELNAGKVGYNAFGQNALTFVGAGTNASNRAVYFYAEGGTTFGGPASFNGNVFVNNNIQVNQKVTATQTGTANLVPVCYGTIDGTGAAPVILSGSGNFTVSSGFAGHYSIIITGKFLTDNNYTAVVTCRRAGLSGGAYFWHFPGVLPSQNPAGGLEVLSSNGNQKFSFVVYMPN